MAQAPVAVILAGGVGERFWPLSTPQRPKQLLHLSDPSKSLLEESIDRARSFCSDVFVVTGKGIGGAILESGLLPEDRLLIEPVAKNTLGALCWAVSRLREFGFGPEATMAVLAADHAIQDSALFRETAVEAVELAERTHGLVTIGVPPSRPETGYGYIQWGDAVEGGFRVRRFLEKPDIETARAFVDSSEYLWNSGMFFWKIGAFQSELATHQPEIAAMLSHIETQFGELPSLPVDKALMEKSLNVYVVPARFGWDDVGAWDAIGRTHELDADGNAVMGEAALIDSSNCIVVSEGIKVGVLGVSDLVVVATPSGVLVCPRSQAQRVREIAAKMN